MASIFADSNDGHCTSNPTNFAGARNHVGGFVDSNNVFDITAIFHQYYSGRGTHAIRRAFFEFDTSDINNPPSSAFLSIWGVINGDGDLIAVKSEHGNPLAIGDFNSFPSAAVTALGNSDGIGTGSFHLLPDFTYSAEVTTWSTSGSNKIVLNATALSDIATLDTFKVCVMNHDRDYRDLVATSNENNGIRWTESPSTIRDPYLDITISVPATFFGANF